MSCEEEWARKPGMVDDVQARCFSQIVSRSTSMPKPFRTQSRQRDQARLAAVLSKHPLSCWANPGVVEG
jgi:hypothetical protein